MSARYKSFTVCLWWARALLALIKAAVAMYSLVNCSECQLTNIVADFVVFAVNAYNCAVYLRSGWKLLRK